MDIHTRHQYYHSTAPTYTSSGIPCFLNCDRTILFLQEDLTFYKFDKHFSNHDSIHYFIYIRVKQIYETVQYSKVKSLGNSSAFIAISMILFRYQKGNQFMGGVVVICTECD
jgi:hypothetical protein